MYVMSIDMYKVITYQWWEEEDEEEDAIGQQVALEEE